MSAIRISRRFLILASLGVLFCAAFAAPSSVAAQGVDEDFRLGKGLYNQGFFDRAIPALERVRQGGATPAQLEETLFLLGEAYRSSGDAEKAAQRFGAMLQQFPSSQWVRLARVGRGECLVRTRKFGEAVQVLNALLRDPGDEKLQGLYWLGEAHSRAGSVEEAVTAYRSLIDESAEDALAPYAAYNAGLLLRDADRSADGVALLQKIDIGKAPKEIADQLWLLSGDLLLRAGDPQRSIQAYTQVAEGDLMRSALAGICWAARDLDERDVFAIAHETLKNRFGDSEEALDVDLLLGSWCAETGDWQGADKALNGRRNGPRGSEAQFWRSWARSVAGRHEEAAREYQRIASGDDRWSLDASYRVEGEFRKCEKWREALDAATAFLAKNTDVARGADVLAGAVESAYRVGEDTKVLELERRFRGEHEDHALTLHVMRFAAEAALRSSNYDEAIARFAQLWSSVDDAEKQELGPRFAWALVQKDPAAFGDELTIIRDDIKGTAAAEVGILLGRTRAAEKEIGAAERAFKAAIAADPDGDAGARARLELAVLMQGGTDVAAAEKAYREILSKSAPPEIRARATIDLAELLAGRGGFEEAIPLFERYISEHGSGEFIASAQLGLAFSCWRVGRHDDALRSVVALRRVTKDETTLAEGLYVEGRVRADKKDHAAAATALGRYLSSYPGGAREAEVLRELARVEEESNRPADAIAHLQQLVEKHSNVTGVDEALYRLGWLQGEADDAEASKASFRALIDGYPQSNYVGDAHYRLGDYAYDEGSFEDARSHYRAAQSSPDQERLAERARYRIAWSYVREESWKEAQKEFTALADADSAGELAGESLFLAADAAGHLSDNGAERKLLERFVTGHPNHELGNEGRIRLAELLTDAKEWSRTRDLLDPLRGAKLDGDLEPRHRIALGRALVRAGNAQSSLPLFKDALKKGEAFAAEAQFEMGLAYRKMGDRTRAIETFINGPVLYPYRPWAIRSYLEAGRDLIEEGKQSEAKRVLELAVKQDSQGQWGKEARKLLGSIGKES